MPGGGSASVARDDMRNTRDSSQVDEQRSRVSCGLPLIALDSNVSTLGLVVGCVTWAVVTWGFSESPSISDFGAEPTKMQAASPSIPTIAAATPFPTETTA